MIRYLRDRPRKFARPALFLDRDGVLNRHKADGYVIDPAEFALIDMALGSARIAQEAGALLVVITNQGCIGRGIAAETNVMAVHTKLLDALSERDIQLSAIYVCPHHPSALDPSGRDCQCRKPKPGMILQAAEDLNINLGASVLIGDQQSDIDAARAAGIRDEWAISVNQGGKHAIEAATRAAFESSSRYRETS